MKKILQTTNQKLQTSKGFTLLFSVLVAALLLSLGLAIFNIIIKELALSSTISNSQVAFYSADTGASCALYWDRDQGVFSTSSAPSSIDCAGDNRSISGSNGNYSFEIGDKSGDEYCASVTIDKTGSTTTIESRGNYTCDENIPRRVERAIRVTY